MEYQVPQFIDVEDKIVGPLTMRQFIYVAGAAGLCIVFFSYFSFFFAFILSIPVVGFGVALAFYKVNSKPFIEMLEAVFNYYRSEKLLIWKQKGVSAQEQGANATAAARAAAESEAAKAPRGAPRLTSGKLSELAWSLDVKKNDITTRANS
jgi:hypothetical protein